MLSSSLFIQLSWMKRENRREKQNGNHGYPWKFPWDFILVSKKKYDVIIWIKLMELNFVFYRIRIKLTRDQKKNSAYIWCGSTKKNGQTNINNNNNIDDKKKTINTCIVFVEYYWCFLFLATKNVAIVVIIIKSIILWDTCLYITIMLAFFLFFGPYFITFWFFDFLSSLSSLIQS